MDVLGKQNMPSWRVAETWEISDHEGAQSIVKNGHFGGKTLRDLTRDHPEQLIGAGWQGEKFPLLAKLIDGAAMLPVHLHADDEAAKKYENEPNGKSEAWHILAAGTGATALVGLKDGIGKEELRAALLRQDYDSVMRRIPVRAGDTIYVPGGTLHSFGPETLVYEIQQTSDVLQSAMPLSMRDGSEIPVSEWHRNIEALLQQIHLEIRPRFSPGLPIDEGNDVERLLCCVGPYFALERWRIGNIRPLEYAFTSVRLITNIGSTVQIEADGWSGILNPADSIVLPAALEGIRVTGPGDLLIAYIPDVQKDIIEPLTNAGYGRQQIESLGPIER